MLRRCLRKRLRFLLCPEAGWHDSPQATAAYRQWTWINYHAKLLRVRAFILIIQILQYLRDIKNTFQQVQVYGMILLVATIAILTFHKASVTTAAQWASRAVILFSVLQGITTIHIAVGGAPAGSLTQACAYWLDLITHILIVVPCLALADFQRKAYLCYFFWNMLAGIPFHMKILGYGLSLAISKALCMQAVPLIAYALLERNKCATFKRHISTASAGSQGTHCSKLGCTPVQPVSITQDFCKPHPQGHVKAPLAANQSTAPEGCKPCKYISPLRRLKAHVKLESRLNPEDLSEEAIKLLPEAAASCLNDGCLVSTAIRHGCIVLSIDVCELQPVARQEQLAGNVGDLTQQVLIKWLQKSGLEQQLQHGSTLVIQVEGHLWNCSWDANTQTWSVEEDASQRSGFSLSVPDVALFMPPSPGPYTTAPLTFMPPSPGPYTTAPLTFMPPSPGPYTTAPLTFMPPSPGPYTTAPLTFMPPSPGPYTTAPLTFTLTITAPSAFQLVGWQEAGASEQQRPLASQEQAASVLQLLVHTCGRFLPVSIQHMECDDEQGGRSRVEVCVSCPADILTLECSQLRLELVQGDFLLSNCTTMLAHGRLAEAVKELKAWVAQASHTPAQISEFIGDLSEWLSFDSLVHLSEEGKSMLIKSVQAGPHPCMMPSLVAGAQRPGALNMMAEVGLDLLRHVVSCGMSQLSERVLAGLLAAPLHVPFSTVAHGSLLDPSPPSTSSVAGSPQPPSQPQSLLAYAIMSNDEAMLSRVLAWGHQYGEPGFSWSEAPAGQHTAAADISMLHMLCSLPDAGSLRASHAAHAMLCRLLQDPLAKPVTQCARGVLPTPTDQSSHEHAHTEAEQAVRSLPLPRNAVAGAAHGTQVQATAQQQLQQALEQQQGFKKPSLAETAISEGQMEASEVEAEVQVASSSRPGSSSELAHTGDCTNLGRGRPCVGGSAGQWGGSGSTGVFSLASLALVLGFGEGGEVKESEYRCWLSDTTAGIVKACCTGVVMYFWYTAMKSAYEGLLLNAIIVALYPMPMVLLLITKQRQTRQASMLLAIVFHVSYYFLFGLGVLPSIIARKLALTHLDLIVEIIIFRLFMQVPLNILLLERATIMIGFTLLYLRLSLPYPIIQAVAVNLASLAVGIVLEVRNRRIYLRIQNNLMRTAEPGAAGKLVAQEAKKDK